MCSKGSWFIVTMLENDLLETYSLVYTVYYMCLLLVYRNFLMHFSLDPRLLNSVRGMKRNFVGDVMMWKEKGVLGFHSHDMS